MVSTRASISGGPQAPRRRPRAAVPPSAAVVARPGAHRAALRCALREWANEAAEGSSQRTARETAANKIAQAWFMRYARLDLSGLGLTTLPRCIDVLDELTSLLLNNNALEELPASIVYLSKLRVLNLRNNRLTRLPDDMKPLESLATVSLNGNALETVPVALARLPGLRNLYLHGNQLGVVPEELARLPRVVLMRCGLETRPPSETVAAPPRPRPVPSLRELAAAVVNAQRDGALAAGAEAETPRLPRELGAYLGDFVPVLPKLSTACEAPQSPEPPTRYAHRDRRSTYACVGIPGTRAHGTVLVSHPSAWPPGAPTGSRTQNGAAGEG